MKTSEEPKKPALYKGACLCGAILFEAVGPALKPHTCSCKMCQRHSGSLTTVWVEFPAPSVTWTGDEPATYRASDFSSRAFCGTCGSTLGSIDDAPTIGLVLGVFDKESRPELMPTAHSYKGKRPKWWHVDASPP
jgi:hypothetical protein